MLVLDANPMTAAELELLTYELCLQFQGWDDISPICDMCGLPFDKLEYGTGWISNCDCSRSC